MNLRSTAHQATARSNHRCWREWKPAAVPAVGLPEAGNHLAAGIAHSLVARSPHRGHSQADSSPAGKRLAVAAVGRTPAARNRRTDRLVAVRSLVEVADCHSLQADTAVAEGAVVDRIPALVANARIPAGHIPAFARRVDRQAAGWDNADQPAATLRAVIALTDPTTAATVSVVVAAAMGYAAFSVDEAPCRFSAPRKRRNAPGRGGAPVLGGSHSPHQVDRIAISIEGSAGAGAMRGGL